MKEEKISEIIGNIDKKFVDEASLPDCGENAPKVNEVAKMAEPARRFAGINIRFAAAVLVVAAVSLFAVWNAEAKEFREATEFFEKNKVSTEGLTRTEVKAVYHDITTKSFTNSKTREITRQVVPGWETEQYDATPEEVAEVWDKKEWLKQAPSIFDGIKTDEAVLTTVIGIPHFPLDDREIQLLEEAFEGWDPEAQKASSMEILDMGASYVIKFGDDLTIGFLWGDEANHTLTQRVKDGKNEYMGWLNGKVYWFSQKIQDALDQIATWAFMMDQ